MTYNQLSILVTLYKKAVKNELTVWEFENEIKQTRIQIDASFAKEGKEDINLGEYLNELLELQTQMI